MVMRVLQFASLLLLAFAPAMAQQSTDHARVYRTGVDGVQPPQAVFTPEPELPEQVRKEMSTRVAILSAVVGVDGEVHNLKLVRSTGDSSMDNKALEKVATWKFHPGTKSGRAVNCAINLAVTFRLARDRK
jgi:protein TonB